MKRALLFVALSAGCATIAGCATTSTVDASIDDAPTYAEARWDAFQALAGEFRDAFGQDVTILLRDGRMIVQLSSEVLFESGSTALGADGRAAMNKVGTIIKGEPERRFLIAGHTDNVPVNSAKRGKSKARQSYTDNWELSTLRALNAVRHLEKQGVDPKYIGAAGFGENLPHATNDTDAGRAENRRLEIIVFPKAGEFPRFEGSL